MNFQQISPPANPTSPHPLQPIIFSNPAKELTYSSYFSLSPLLLRLKSRKFPSKAWQLFQAFFGRFCYFSFFLLRRKCGNGRGVSVLLSAAQIGGGGGGWGGRLGSWGHPFPAFVVCRVGRSVLSFKFAKEWNIELSILIQSQKFWRICNPGHFLRLTRKTGRLASFLSFVLKFVKWRHAKRKG